MIKAYPELFSSIENLPAEEFGCESQAVNHFCAVHGEDLMAVINEETLEVIQEFSESTD